jgi:hypothetical protein
MDAQPSTVFLAEHELETVRAVLAGNFVPLEFVDVPCGSRVVLSVSTDVLALTASGPAVRVGTTPILAQLLADHFDCVCATPAITDAIWAAAEVRLLPHGQWSPGANIASREFERRHSAAIDTELAGRPGLAATLGKSWALCARLWPLWQLNRRRVTYGWPYPTRRPQTYPSATGLGGWVIQPPPPDPLSEGHNDQHHDYSQTWRAVRRACQIDGQPADLVALLTGPDAAEVSTDGTLPAARFPGVPLAPLSTLVAA